MKKLLNEVKRMQKIAGIISEGQYEERADTAKSNEITMEGDEVDEGALIYKPGEGYVEYNPDEDDENFDDEEFDEDELPPINKAELVSFIRKAGPKPTGAKPRGEFNVSLDYVDYPSIPDSYMTGAMDVFMCVVKACGGKAKLEGQPGPNQMYTVMGCSFDNLQAIWQFLASNETYETAGDSDTIVQANGCAQTWEINSDYDQNDSTQDPDYDPRYDSSVP